MCLVFFIIPFLRLVLMKFLQRGGLRDDELDDGFLRLQPLLHVEVEEGQKVNQHHEDAGYCEGHHGGLCWARFNYCHRFIAKVRTSLALHVVAVFLITKVQYKNFL